MSTMKQLQSDLKWILDEDDQSSEIEIEKALIEKVLSEFAELERNSVGESKRILDLEAKNSKLEKEIKKVNGMVEKSLVVDDKLKKEASGVKKQKSELEKKIKEKERAIKEADATIVKQREEISGLSNQNSELEVQLKKREEELKSSKEELKQMQDNIGKAMEETISDLETKLAIKEYEIKATEEKLKSEMLKLMDQDAKHFQDRDRRALKTKVEELKSSNDDMFQLMDQAKQQEDHRLGQALQDLETTLTSTEKKLKSLKKEMKIKLMDAKETEASKMTVYRNKVLNSVMELEKVIKDHEDKTDY